MKYKVNYKAQDDAAPLISRAKICNQIKDYLKSKYTIISEKIREREARIHKQYIGTELSMHYKKTEELKATKFILVRATIFNSGEREVFSFDTVTGKYVPFDKEDLRFFDKLDFKLSVDHRIQAKQFIEDWFGEDNE